MKKPEPKKIKYKLRIVADVEGEIEESGGLRENTGIEHFLTWAAEDIEDMLEGVCEIVEVKKIELEET